MDSIHHAVSQIHDIAATYRNWLHLTTQKDWIEEHRVWFYVVTVIWTFFEGETFVLIAAAATVGGELSPYTLCACAWLGSWLGDQTWFFLGRRCGPFLLRRRPKLRHGIDAVHRWMERWDTLFILTFRFMYGLRNFSSVALGLSDVPVWRFMSLNFVGAGLWSITFVSAGVIFGNTLGHLLGQYAEHFETVALGVFVAILVLVVFIARWRSRRSRRVSLMPAERP